MATIFRAPLVQRIVGVSAVVAVAAQTGVQTNLLASTLGQDQQFQGAGQFQGYNLPVPNGYPFPIGGRTFLLPSAFWLLQDQFFGSAGQPPTYPPDVPYFGRRPPDVSFLGPTPIGLYTAPLPVSTIALDWPNPTRKPWTVYPTSYRPASVKSAQPFPTGIVFDNPVLGKYPTLLRTFLRPYDAYLVPAPVPATFGQNDWPNPRIAPFPLENRGFIGSIDLDTLGQDALPFTLKDAPNPRGYAYGADLRTYIDPLNLALLGQDQFFGSPGQPPTTSPVPNPMGRAFSVDARTLSAASPNTTLLPVGPVPFSLLHWPQPPGPAYPIALRTFIGYYVLDQTPPFVNSDWPNPTVARSTVFLRDYQEAAQVFLTPAPPPFAQTDWPNPAGYVFSRELRTWLDRYALVRIGVDALPFAQFDWPNPKGYGFLIDLRTFLQTIDLETIGQDVLPFLLSDFPNPRGYPFSVELRTFLQRLRLAKDQFFGAPGQPPTYQPPPNPRGATFPIDLRTATSGLSPGTAKAVIKFRKTLSPIGSGVGKRQKHKDG